MYVSTSVRAYRRTRIQACTRERVHANGHALRIRIEQDSNLRVVRQLVFKTSAFNHSAIYPVCVCAVRVEEEEV